MFHSTCMVSEFKNKYYLQMQIRVQKNWFNCEFSNWLFFITENESSQISSDESTTAQTSSEIASSSEFQKCLDRATDLSQRIRDLSSKIKGIENAKNTNYKNSENRLSRRQSFMIRRIFEKYADIIGMHYILCIQ